MKHKTFFLLILTSLIFVLFSFYVSGAKGCCEKTVSGNYCSYTNESECDPAAKFTYTTCEQTSFCQTGCCYSSDEGKCFKNTPRKQCEEQNDKNVWKEKANCEIDQCIRGCCVIGSEASFVTEVRCKKETEKFKDIKMSFNKEIKTEADCVASVKNLEKGCCIKQDNTCEFTNRGNCPTSTTEVKFVNASSDVGFHKDTLCSNDQLSCDCAKQQRTECVDDSDKVYWFDSCGNRENVYDIDKVKSYNNGFVLEEPTCTLAGPNDANCGNCNYDEGTICSKDTEHLAKYGNSICVGTDCKKTWDDKVSPNSGGDKKNGESWCIYDSQVGNAKDVVGSRHYRHLCINGEEMTETCKDFRDEICIQGILGKAPTETYEALQKKAASTEYVEASCRDNRWEDCVNCNAVDSCPDAECAGLKNEGKNQALKDCCSRKCCIDVEKRDCYWLNGGITAAIGGSGSCVPEVPPGLKFWGESDEKTPSTTTTGNGPEICDNGDTECKVIWKRGGWSRIFSRDDWDVLQNEHCTKSSWVVAGNTYCKSLGDCGAYYNILGKSTADGYDNTASDEDDWFDGYTLTKTDIGDWNTLSSPTRDENAPNFMKEFLEEKNGWFILAGLAGSGLYGGFTNPGGAKFGDAFKAGITGGPSSILSVFGFSKFGKTAASIYGNPTTYTANIPAKTVLSQDEALKLLDDVPKTAKEQANVLKGKGLSPVEGGWQTNAEMTVPDGTTIEGAPTGGGLMSVANTILWMYTVYQLVDVIAAETEEKTYTIDCLAWQAPRGGSDCEKCNDPMKPCSEYKCKSLGTLCAIVNAGSKNESCISLHPNDVNSPIITPNKKAMNFSVTEVSSEGNKGFKIDKEIEAFTAITLSVNTNEPAQCKLSEKPKQKYEEMASYLGSSEYLYNHSMLFSPPGQLAEEQAIKLTNGGNYKIYIRCIDGNGNANDRDYFINFKIKPGPDLTPPEIKFTSIQNNAYVAASTTASVFSLFVNEPAQCKWSRIDQHYDQMNKSMSCSTSPASLSTIFAGTYECSTQLTNFTFGENKFYFRCKDKPSAEEKDRNVNEDSFIFTLKGTKGLNITSIGPTGLIYRNYVSLKAKTRNGAEDGRAICGYNKDVPAAFESMIAFVNTSSDEHEQGLTELPIGAYLYYITCQDVAGNSEERNITFTISVDTEPPILEEVYVDYTGPILHLKFNEESTCEYKATSGFKLGEGAQMLSPNSTIQETTANLENYYVICKDKFNNLGNYVIEL